jgi:hypothetical protein
MRLNSTVRSARYGPCSESMLPGLPAHTASRRMRVWQGYCPPSRIENQGAPRRPTTFSLRMIDDVHMSEGACRFTLLQEPPAANSNCPGLSLLTVRGHGQCGRCCAEALDSSVERSMWWESACGDFDLGTQARMAGARMSVDVPNGCSCVGGDQDAETDGRRSVVCLPFAV